MKNFITNLIASLAIVCVLVIAIVFLLTGRVWAVEIAVGNVVGHHSIEVPINLSHNLGHVAIAFTLIYDPTSIELAGIESGVFDLIEVSEISTGARIAAGCFESDSNVLKILTGQVPSSYDDILDVNGDGVIGLQELIYCESSTLFFTLTFQLKPGKPLGIYAVEIVNTILSDSEAGYNPGGEAIPILVGYDSQYELTDSRAFPVIINPPIIGSVQSGSVEFVECILGDANGSGVVNIWDALLIAEYSAELIGEGDVPGFACSDVNCSGVVNIWDALKIAEFAAELIPNLDCE